MSFCVLGTMPMAGRLQRTLQRFCAQGNPVPLHSSRDDIGEWRQETRRGDWVPPDWSWEEQPAVLPTQEREDPRLQIQGYLDMTLGDMRVCVHVHMYVHVCMHACVCASVCSSDEYRST